MALKARGQCRLWANGNKCIVWITTMYDMMCIVESHKWCGNSTIAEVEYISTELYKSIRSPQMSATRGCIGKFKVRAVGVSHCKSIFYVTPTKDTEQIEIPSNSISHFAKPAISQLCNWRATLKSPLLILNQSSHTDVMANLRSRGPRGIIRTGPLEVRSALSASPVLLREISPSLFSRATMTNRRWSSHHGLISPPPTI